MIFGIFTSTYAHISIEFRNSSNESGENSAFVFLCVRDKLSVQICLTFNEVWDWNKSLSSSNEVDAAHLANRFRLFAVGWVWMFVYFLIRFSLWKIMFAQFIKNDKKFWFLERTDWRNHVFHAYCPLGCCIIIESPNGRYSKWLFNSMYIYK